MAKSAVRAEEPKLELGDLVAKARAGDDRARERILHEYRPFFLRVASSVCRKYLVLGRDDEASIAMIAFNEAIDAYDDTRSVISQLCGNCH